MKKIIILLLMIGLLSVCVLAFTTQTFLNIDVDSENINVVKNGLSYYYDENGNLIVLYSIEHDMIVKYAEDDFGVERQNLTYNINLKNFINCVESNNMSYCKDDLVSSMREYFKYKLENKRNIMKEMQREEAMTEDQAVSNLLDLDVGVIE